MNTILKAISSDPDLTEIFEQVGVSVEALTNSAEAIERDEKGQINVANLLEIVQIAGRPTKKRQFQDLRYRIFVYETRTLDKMKHLSQKIDEIQSDMVKLAEGKAAAPSPAPAQPIGDGTVSADANADAIIGSILENI